MRTVCGCGLRMGNYGGVEGVTIEECEWCASHGGLYSSSPYWDTKRDKEDAQRVRQGMAYKEAMNNVTPMHRTKQGKKGKRVA